MALMAFMYAVGQKSGQIKGSITQKGREDSVGVLAYSHEIMRPLDAHSGLATGARIHKPLIVEKELDKSTPIFYNLMCTSENLTSVTLKFWTAQLKTASGVGSEVQHYTIKLINAHIASMESSMPDISHPDLAKIPQTEKIAFTFQKIEWTWNDGGIAASDDWEARV